MSEDALPNQDIGYWIERCKHLEDDREKYKALYRTALGRLRRSDKSMVSPYDDLENYEVNRAILLMASAYALFVASDLTSTSWMTNVMRWREDYLEWQSKVYENLESFAPGED